MNPTSLMVRALTSLMFVCATSAHAASAPADIRLYAIDCGSADFVDLAVAADTGEYDGRAGHFVDPCFLVHHPHGWLLWDAGLPPALPEAQRVAFASSGITLRSYVPLADRLHTLGLTAGDIDFVAFSHLHFDHVGNANQFATSTWILERAELAWAAAEPPHVSVTPDLFEGYRHAKTIVVDGDHDVFGDGSVRILSMPGHTPGSAALLVNLRHAGAVLLSGDLYVQRQSRRKHLVPLVNADRAATLASMDRFEAIARNRHARVIVQHDREDFAALPLFPRYLD